MRDGIALVTNGDAERLVMGGPVAVPGLMQGPALEAGSPATVGRSITRPRRAHKQDHTCNMKLRGSLSMMMVRARSLPSLDRSCRENVA